MNKSSIENTTSETSSKKPSTKPQNEPSVNEMKKIPVRVVFRKSRALVVERMVEGIPERVSVPESYVEVSGSGATFMSSDLFERGIPFGLPLEDRLTGVTVTPAMIAEEFHKAGIWTASDIRKNPKAAHGAVLAASRDILAQIQHLVAEYERKED